MKIGQIQTRQLAHCVALWMLANALLIWAWSGRVDDGYWLAVFNDARIHPIPALAWLIAFLPTLVTIIVSSIVIVRNDKTRLAVVEAICANLVGVGLFLNLLVWWCMNGL